MEETKGTLESQYSSRKVEAGGAVWEGIISLIKRDWVLLDSGVGNVEGQGRRQGVEDPDACWPLAAEVPGGGVGGRHGGAGRGRGPGCAPIAARGMRPLARLLSAFRLAGAGM